MNKFTRVLGALAPWLLAAVAHAGTVTYVYTDPQGTPLAEANASGTITARFDYAPYGQSVTSMGAAPNGPGYTGHVNDPDTGLVYMQARYYDPEVGRFLSVDPVGPTSANSFTFNRYVYVNNNPTAHTDPTGMVCGGNGEVSAKIQAMRDTSDGCDGSSSEYAKANSSGNALAQDSSNVASRSEYTQDIPEGIAAVVTSPLVQGWKKAAKDSPDFNARPSGVRKEHGVWVYGGASGEIVLVSMPDSEANPITGIFNGINAGIPPSITGYNPLLAIHTHPFALPDGQSRSLGYTIMGYPQPSQKDINYSRDQHIPGMVISHRGDYFFGVPGTGK